MGSIGRTVRGTMSALALSFAAVGTLSVLAAPAAMAQNKASQKFVEAYTAAGNALKAKDWAGALSKADAAASEASNNQQKAAVESIRVQAYHGKGDKANEAKALETLCTLDASSCAKNKDTLLGLYADTQPAKAEEMIKASPNASSVNLGWLANRMLATKRCPDATKYAQMAIDAARKEGKKPLAAYYNIKLKCFNDAKDMVNYYKTLEEAAPMFPEKANDYFKPLIDKTLKDKFNRTYALDLFRAYTAAKVPLTSQDKADAVEQAFQRKMWVEAETIADPLIKDGTIGGPKDGKAERNKRAMATIQTEAKNVKGGSLAAAETAAASQPTGLQYTDAGEGYFGLGKWKEAADAIKKGLDKGGLKPDEEAFAKLHLGIAQLKAGQKDAARATWGGIKSETGAESLAHAWIAISKL